MLDIKFIRENKELIAFGSTKKRSSFNVENLIASDDDRLALLKEVEEFRAKQNKVGEKMAMVGAFSEMERVAVIEEMKALKETLKQKEEKLEETMKEWRKLMLAVPNIPDMTVPEGESDADNV